MAHDVFISFKSENQETAEKIFDDLTSKGIKCWISSRGIRGGQNYQEEIVKALKDAAIMVLVFSASADKSDEIKKELGLASKYKKHVIPVRIEDFFPGEKYEYELATRQYIDLFKNWEKETDHLAEDIKFMMASTVVNGQQAEQQMVASNITSAANIVQRETAGDGNVDWLGTGHKFIKAVKKNLDVSSLPFKPTSVSDDREIEEEKSEPEIDWWFDDNYYFAAWLTNKRKDKIDVRWGIYSDSKRNPAFRKASDELEEVQELLDKDEDISINGVKYLWNDKLDCLGQEASERKLISEINNPEFIKHVVDNLLAYANKIWPVVKKNLVTG